MNAPQQIEANLQLKPEQDSNAESEMGQEKPAVRARLPSHVSKICDTCTRLLEIVQRESREEVSFPENVAELQESPPLSCRFCYLRWCIMPPLERIKFRDRSKVAIKFYGNNHDGFFTITYSTKLAYYTMSIGFDQCTNLDLQHGIDSSSPSTFSMINNWIDKCHHNHEGCGIALQTTLSASIFPAGRILDLEPDGPDSSASGNIRLVDGRTLTGDSKFISLSHRWGSYEPLKLTRETERFFKNGIYPQRLAKTFADAIDITRRLGIKYLWIDSLCIVQDDEDDWKTESAKMAQIYERAWLNIAAVKAQDAREGCYTERESRDVTPLVAQIAFDCATHHYYYLFNSKMWDVDIRDSPLMRRAWVQQEQYFSRRTLYFAQHQVFWRCQQTTACEMLPGGMSRWEISYFLQKRAYLVASLREGDLISTEYLQQQLLEDRAARNNTFREYLKKGPPEDHPQRELFEAWKLNLTLLEIWCTIVTQYSSCEMTFPVKDKIIAISGIARRCGRASDYLAGLWRSTLPWQLLWRVKDGWKNQTHSRLPGSPSWSWTSVHRGITMHKHLTLYGEFEHDKPLMEVLEAETQLVGDDPFGPVDGGYVTLAGFMLKTRISIMDEMVWKCQSDFSNNFMGFMSYEDDLGNSHGYSMLSDSSPSQGKHLEGSFGYYLPILRGPIGWEKRAITGWEGLWLEPTGRRPGEYLRRGYFFLPLETPKYWPEEFKIDQVLEVEEYEQYEGKHSVGDGKSPQMCHRYRITIV